MDYMTDTFNSMVDELKHMTIDSYEQEIERLQADAVNIRLQVNQHMLLNSLNTIHSLSLMGRKTEAEQFCMLLVKYFRYALRQDTALVPLREEMAFVDNYIKIQQIRFPNSFLYSVEMDESCGDAWVPQLLIQNFVENAIKHGRLPGKTMRLTIRINRDHDMLNVRIQDNGSGMKSETLIAINSGKKVMDQNGQHIGIWNCLRRMRLFYGNNWCFEAQSKEEAGTMISIRLPVNPPETEVSAQDRRMERRILDDASDRR